MRFSSSAGAVLLSFAAFVSAIDFNPDDEASIKSVTSQYAHGLMSFYVNNATDLPKEEIGIFPKPHYWWEAGAAWGGMIEYTQFTGDESYVKTVTQALAANYGPDNNIILPWRRDQQGNDDQAFWALAIMSALEYQFPEPEAAPAKYIDVVVNAFENIVARWDETTCDGGLKWQIYPENAYGFNYKNSISNGAVFALGARLARYTGEQKYADWAVKLYDWTVKTGLISGDFAVFDGTDDKTNCAKVADETEWSYNVGVFLHGAATMYDYTKGDEKWKKSTAGLLNHASVFFNPFDNATDIMYERACETGGYQVTGRHCNLDQQSFKAYLARFMAKTAILAPFTKDKVTTLLTTSAIGAAKACSGGDGGVMCGSKWFTGSWDGTTGVGQQLSALEVTQALLMLKQNIVPGTAGAEKPTEPKPTASSSAAVESNPAPTSTTIAEAVSSATPSEVASSAVASEVASSATPSEVIPSAVPSSTGAPAAPVSTDAGYVPGTTAVPSATDKPEAPAPSSSGSPISSGKPAVFPETGPNCSRTTLTIYYSPLPTTSVPVPEPTAPVTAPSVPVAEPSVPIVEPSAPAPVPTEPVTIPSTVVPPPASNTTVPPAEFTGAASNIRMTGFSVLGAVAVAALVGLF